MFFTKVSWIQCLHFATFKLCNEVSSCWTSLLTWWVNVSNISGIEPQSQFSRYLGKKMLWRKFKVSLGRKKKEVKSSVVSECKILPNVEVEYKWAPKQVGAENHSRKRLKARE